MAHVKGRFAAVLWLSGFVLAGIAAALVNSLVLSNDSASGQLRGGGISIAAAGSTAAPFEAQQGDTPGSYLLGDAGSVQLSTEGGRLSLVSTDPATGWSVSSVVSTTPTSLTVVFVSGGHRLEFEAVLVDGKVTATITDLGDDGSTGVPTGTTVPRSPSNSTPVTTGTTLPRSTTTDDGSTDDSTEATEATEPDVTEATEVHDDSVGPDDTKVDD